MKEKARRLEAKGQLDKAVRQYAKILEELNGRPELADELALYNKLGDLYIKLGNTTSGVEEYEKAINHYAEQGFPNNAIALCNKVLRNAPGRTHIYLKLAKLMMQRGFASEAKQNLLQYAERMQKAGKLEEAFLALKEFADISPDNEEVRLILADQLKKAARTDEAHEQLAKLYDQLKESGNKKRTRATLEKMRAIDPEYDLDAASVVPSAKPKKGKSSDIVFLDLDDDIGPVTASDVQEKPEELEEPIEPLEVEATSLAVGVDGLASVTDDLDREIVRSAAEVDSESDADEVTPIEGLDVGETFDGVLDVAVPALDIETTALDDSLDVPEIEIGEELPDFEVPFSGDEMQAAELEEPESAYAAVSDDDAISHLPMLEVPAAADDIEMIEVGEEEEFDTAVPGAQSLEELPMLDVGSFEERVDDIELDMPWDVDVDDVVIGAPDISALEFAVADDPAAPAPHRELGEALIETGDRERGMQELDFALEGYQAAGDMRHAQDVVDEILRLEPNSIQHHQKRVELALQEGDDAKLVNTYLDLAGALVRCEEFERARFVYERVLERDPDNDRAQIALDTLLPRAAEPEPAPPHEPEFVEAAAIEEPEAAVAEADTAAAPYEPEFVEAAAIEQPEAAVAEADTAAAPYEPEFVEAAAIEQPEAVVDEAEKPDLIEAVEPKSIARERVDAGGYVDLGALIMDEEEAVKDTRMRIDREEPVHGEEHDFAEMLSEFKRGIDANIDADDAQSHYDLGVAFKEMGLLDEAVSEFQKALRGAEHRLRTSESLGLCFFEKGQFAVAATVLRRAIEAEKGGDDDKIGLLYWLGRCEEQQGRRKEALGYYQRIFSIDINFQDVSDRVNNLTDASG